MTSYFQDDRHGGRQADVSVHPPLPLAAAYAVYKVTISVGSFWSIVHSYLYTSHAYT